MRLLYISGKSLGINMPQESLMILKCFYLNIILKDVKIKEV